MINRLQRILARTAENAARKDLAELVAMAAVIWGLGVLNKALERRLSAAAAAEAEIAAREARLAELRDLTDERVEARLAELHERIAAPPVNGADLAECGRPAPCGHAPDGGNHPVAPGWPVIDFGRDTAAAVD